MSEYTISRDDSAADVFALQDALNVLKASALWDSPTAKRLLDLRRSIDEQVEPAIEEPLAFGSVIRAEDGTLYVRVGAVQHPWRAGNWFTSWDGFGGVAEVIRVGIGEPSDEEQAAAKYEATTALADAYSRGYHEGFESNLPSPVDRSVINSAISEAAAEIIAREGRLLGVGYAHELTDAVMKALARPVEDWDPNTDYLKGVEDFAAKARREIATLRAKVVTGPEKRTCDDLLALVGVLQGLS